MCAQFRLVKRRLPYCPDPGRLYDAATKRLGRANSFMLESADISTRQGERTIIGVRSCLRVSCRDARVHIDSSNPTGDAILTLVDDKLAAVRHTSGSYVFPDVRMMTNERAKLRAPSPTDALRAILEIEIDGRFMLAGGFSYDFVDVYEHLPPAQIDHLDQPDFAFTLPDLLIEINHRQGYTELSQLTTSDRDSETLGNLEDICRWARDAGPIEAPVEVQRHAVSVDVSDATYAAWVDALKHHIQAGDIFQIVASRTFSVPCDDPLGAYARLKVMNPSPYMFYFDTPDGILFGASPETAVKVSGTPKKVEIRPIAGTKPRGFNRDGTLDLDLDTRLEAELRLDKKELAEHMMLIDLARNDIARVSRAGTRYVPKLLTVDRYAHVMHLVSYVEGQLEEGLDALHAYVASMNMGTLVGAPKIRAAQILRTFEPDKRGPYGGAVGYLASQGDMDTAIVIRSAFVRDGIARVRAGAGIVFDSDANEEVAETRRKAQAVLNALGGE